MTYLCGLLRVRIQLSKNGYVAVETWYKIECELHIYNGKRHSFLQMVTFVSPLFYTICGAKGNLYGQRGREMRKEMHGKIIKLFFVQLIWLTFKEGFMFCNIKTFLQILLKFFLCSIQ